MQTVRSPCVTSHPRVHAFHACREVRCADRNRDARSARRLLCGVGAGVVYCPAARTRCPSKLPLHCLQRYVHHRLRRYTSLLRGAQLSREVSLKRLLYPSALQRPLLLGSRRLRQLAQRRYSTLVYLLLGSVANRAQLRPERTIFLLGTTGRSLRMLVFSRGSATRLLARDLRGLHGASCECAASKAA